MKTPTQLIDKLQLHGGAIVSSNDCSVMEIADAKASGRFAVDEALFGYVWRTPEWLALQRSRENGIPNEQGEPQCQAVGGNAEGKVPTTAPACAPESRDGIRRPGSGAPCVCGDGYAACDMALCYECIQCGRHEAAETDSAAVTALRGSETLRRDLERRLEAAIAQRRSQAEVAKNVWAQHEKQLAEMQAKLARATLLIARAVEYGMNGSTIYSAHEATEIGDQMREFLAGRAAGAGVCLTVNMEPKEYNDTEVSCGSGKGRA